MLYAFLLVIKISIGKGSVTLGVRKVNENFILFLIITTAILMWYFLLNFLGWNHEKIGLLVHLEFY